MQDEGTNDGFSTAAIFVLLYYRNDWQHIAAKLRENGFVRIFISEIFEKVPQTNTYQNHKVYSNLTSFCQFLSKRNGQKIHQNQ